MLNMYKIFKNVCSYLAVVALLIIASLAGIVLTSGGKAAFADYSPWGFDVAYVAEEDPYDVLKTSDFNLKYQVEFHTSEDIPAYDKETGEGVVIRIPATLFIDRNGNPVKPSQLGVPESNPNDEDWAPQKTKNSAFNYYIDEDTDELVFFNYEKIDAGSNDTWQVLYKNLKAMDIIDETSWELTPKAEVTIPVADAEPKTESVSLTSLTGLVDTEVNLTSLTKVAYSATGASYGPGLYTENQVGQYISGSVPDAYKGDNFKEYKYVLYEVKATGKGTQPFKLAFTEKPSVAGAPMGAVVGARAIYPNDLGSVKVEGNALSCETSSKSSWSESFFVVVAYPADSVSEGVIVDNEIVARLTPIDEVDPPQEKSATAHWSYADYHWNYKGNIVGISKWNTNTTYTNQLKEQPYPGWLKAYDTASKRVSSYPSEENSYSDFSFSSQSIVRGYDVSHVTTFTTSDGKTIGEIKDPNASYRTSTVDDAFYGMPAGDPTDGQGAMLGRDDYYFKSVSITQRDYGYDVWEDATATPEVMQGGRDQGIQVWAMLAKPDGTEETDAKGWAKIATVPWADSGIMNYTFDATTLAKEPYRVRVDHETINYQTTCDISVTVHIRATSAKVKSWLASQQEVASVQFENLSGVTVEVLKDGASYQDRFWLQDEGEGNYQEPGLRDFSKDLYGTLPMRDNAFKNTTWVDTLAKAEKQATTENDAINGRLNVDYALTAFDGYSLYSKDAANYLSSISGEQGLVSPGRKDVVFYDLLPYAMEYDPSVKPVAGRVTDLEEKNPKSWDKNQVTVTVEDDDIIHDFNGTGRTLVKFHVHYEGDDPTFFATNEGNSVWAEGWGVTFRGYWSWIDLAVSDDAPNVMAFQPARDDNAPLLGPESAVFADNGSGTDAQGGNEFTDEATVLGKDLDGDGNTEERNVLYASLIVADDVALAAQDSTHKYVRADSDSFGEFRQTAAVKPGETYTYELSVTNPSTSNFEDIVIYDHLESAKADSSAFGVQVYGKFRFDEESWEGSLVSVDTEAAELEGIKPVIWLNAEPNANTQELKDKKTPTEVLTAGNGWYKWDEFMAANDNDPSKAKSVAVDLSLKADGQKFFLESMKSISIRIRMRAPEAVDPSAVWAYNSPIYYSKLDSAHGNVQQTLAGDAVRTALGEAKPLEIEKEFVGETPQAVIDYFGNQPFRIKVEECPLYDPRYGVACPLDNPEAWKADHEGADVPAHEHIPFSDKVYELYDLAEDGSWVKDESRIYATDANGYVELKATQKVKFLDVAEPGRLVVTEEESPFWDVEYETEKDDSIYVKVGNRYKPVLYAEKKLDAVPSTPAGDEARKQGFTFQCFVNGEPAGVTEFWYVTQAYMNGAIPNKDTSKGKNGVGHTDEQGKFTIHEGDIIALRPGKTGDAWEIREVGFEAEDWVSKETTVSGNLELLGSSASITNTYRWKDLLLTKAVTHQDVEEAKSQPFTFKVEQVGGEEDAPTYTPIKGNRWVVMDGSSEMTAEKWAELGRAGEFQGTLSDSGEFTCQCAGMTVKVEHLDAECEFRITEPEGGYGAPLYLPITRDLLVKTPLHSTSKPATYTNDWRKRPITVKKSVEYDREGEFAGTIGEMLKDKTFEMKVEVKNPGDDGFKALDSFSFTLVHEDGTEETQVTDLFGKFPLKANESAVFNDAGFVGAEFRITETPDASPESEAFKQVYPADNEPLTGTLSKDENIATIVNGAPGSFTMKKDYFIPEGDSQARDFYASVLDTLEKDAESLKDEEKALLERAKVTLTLKTKKDGKWVAWPDRDYQVIRTDYKGEKTEFTWHVGEGVTLYPGESVNTKAGQLDPAAEYMVTEAVADRSWIWRLSEGDSEKWLQCEQTTPSGGKSATGIASVNPTVQIVNTISSFDVAGSVAEKHMLYGSEAVPEGSELVWIVEEYDEGRSHWKPAEDVPYIAFAGEGIHNWTGEEVLRTGEDGRITLEASGNGLPWVKFTEDMVALGDKAEPRNGDLRIRELPSESASEWGLLAGYAKEDAEDVFYDDGSGVTLDPTDAIAFVNSNHLTPLEIAKAVTEQTDKAFTMVLEQVIRTSDGKAPTDDASNVQEKTPGANIPYTVFDVESGNRVRDGVTNENGEIVLHGGEYAELNLPDRTFWLVHEADVLGWRVADLTPHNDDDPLDEAVEKGKLHKVGDNCMLARMMAPEIDVPEPSIPIPQTQEEFNATSWEDMAKLAAKCASDGTADYEHLLGFTKDVDVEGVGVVKAKLIRLNHDTYTEGGTAGFTFQLTDGLSTSSPSSFQMNGSSTNSGGWASSLMRSTNLPALKAALPADLQNVIKTVTKKTSTTSSGTAVSDTEDDLFLLSLVESVGADTINYAGNPVVTNLDKK